MYSKEQLEALSKCTSWGDCDDCPNFETNICDWSNSEITENLAKALLAEMERAEEAEHRAAVAESAVEFAIAVGMAHDTENLPQSKEYYIRLAEWDMERDKANQALKEAGECEK